MKKKFHIFEKNHGLTPLQKAPKWRNLKLEISIVKKTFLLNYNITGNYFYFHFVGKKKKEKISYF